MSILDKENAVINLLTGLSTQVTQLQTAVAALKAPDDTTVLAAIANVDADVNKVIALIGEDANAPAASPTPTTPATSN